MVHYMDAIVSRLLSKLRELRLEENTLVLFTGDNGTGGNLVSRLGGFHLRDGTTTMTCRFYWSDPLRVGSKPDATSNTRTAHRCAICTCG